ncbi:MAG: nucleotidyltransferase family protein [Chloroflexota bacterium]
MSQRYENQLVEIIQADCWLMSILRTVRECDLPDWYVGAGTIRNLVWDQLHGYAEPTISRDVDVAFFDPENLTKERDVEADQQLRSRQPEIPWEATNQATVHLWYQELLGQSVQPFSSCEEAIATWPETATSVGVRLLPNDQLQIVAPCGLEDLFQMKLRRNPPRVSLEKFHKRLQEKRIMEKWPKVVLIDG